MIFKEGDASERVAALVAALEKDGHDFTVGIPLDTPMLRRNVSFRRARASATRKT